MYLFSFSVNTNYKGYNNFLKTEFFLSLKSKNEKFSSIWILLYFWYKKNSTVQYYLNYSDFLCPLKFCAQGKYLTCLTLVPAQPVYKFQTVLILTVYLGMYLWIKLVNPKVTFLKTRCLGHLYWDQIFFKKIITIFLEQFRFIVNWRERMDFSHISSNITHMYSLSRYQHLPLECYNCYSW